MDEKNYNILLAIRVWLLFLPLSLFDLHGFTSTTKLSLPFVTHGEVPF
jgi:hypothetical protein